MKYLPVGSKVIVSVLDKEDEKIGSIIIPGSVNAELMYGKIEAVSDDLTEIFTPFQTILFPKGAGVGQLIDGKAHLWLRSDEIWGIEMAQKVVQDKGDNL